MIKKKIAFAALSLIIGVGLGCSRQQQRGPEPQSAGPGRAPAMDVSRLGKESRVTVPVGSAAIKPAGQSVPSFTVETAREYVMAHPFPAFAGTRGKSPQLPAQSFSPANRLRRFCGAQARVSPMTSFSAMWSCKGHSPSLVLQTPLLRIPGES